MAILSYEFLDILEARASKNKQLLNETTLSRVWQHLNDDDKKNFAIITSNRGKSSEKTNIDNFKELKNMLRDAGLGFQQLVGHWQECPLEIPYEDCPKELLFNTVEPTLFVPGISFGLSKEIMDLYHQDSMLYTGPETNSIPTLFFRGGKTKALPNFKPNTIAQAYSTLKNGRNFVFDAPAETPAEVIIERLFNCKKMFL